VTGPGADETRLRRFEDLYRANYAAIYRYVFRRLAPGSKAENAADIAADVFATAWKRIERVPAAPDDRLWLYEVARRSLQHHHRSHSRRAKLNAKLYAEAGVSQSMAGDFAADSDRVKIAIANLRPSDREVFTLIVWDELDNQSVARILGCSANAVAVRLHRARTRLRAQLSESGRPDSVTADNAPSMKKES